MIQDNPKVSVCLMTYNGAATVERALTSLLAQTYHDYELIISDDHSVDGTLAICRRVADGHEQVIFIRPERNIGAQPNMRFGLSHARGKYFVWACQDDYWHPKFLERLVRALEQSPKAICAQGWVRWFSEDETRYHDLRLSGRDLPERQSRLGLATAILTARSQEGNRHGRSVFKNNIFMHGVWDRAAFAVALKAHGKPFFSERQILCQLALSGDFRYVDEMLFRKIFYNVPLERRRPATDATVAARVQKHRWPELRDTLAGIWRSPRVPLRLKLLATPRLATAFARGRLKSARIWKRLVNDYLAAAQ